MLAGWKSVSMDCGGQFVVIMAGITMMPELCADNWDTMWTQMEVSLLIDLEQLKLVVGEVLLCGFG